MKTELQEVAGRIREWQLARGMSDAEVCKRFTGLGSTKTYKRILEGDFEELDMERWLMDFSQVWAVMEIEAASAPIDEPIYEDFQHVTMARVAVEDAMRERGNNRLVIIEGPSGAGKTTAARELQKKWGRKMAMAEADEGWKESPSVMVAALLRALGIGKVPLSKEEQKLRLIESLRSTPVTLVIDDAHHFGPRNLNVCKTLINQTPCQIVLLAVETLLRRLETTSYEEARQLTRNRLAERVRFGAPNVSEVEKFLARRGLHFENGEGRACAKVLAQRSESQGNWNFVNLVARKARRLSGKEGRCDEETFAKAMQQVLATR